MSPLQYCMLLNAEHSMKSVGQLIFKRNEHMILRLHCNINVEDRVQGQIQLKTWPWLTFSPTKTKGGLGVYPSGKCLKKMPGNSINPEFFKVHMGKIWPWLKPCSPWSGFVPGVRIWVFYGSGVAAPPDFTAHHISWVWRTESSGTY